ncbi:MAG: DUF2281 domain-containing protein [Candidatus Lindowbacteria bacterium]|nr:DUF2281 domain-containing protein [Candidatus Lindowbacteria bacterium]
MSLKDAIKKEIDKLPDTLLAEVYDFIQFLESKRDDSLLVKTSQKLSENSFRKVWDNEEDAAYDDL